MTKKIHILVIEDNRLLRDGLAALLDAQTEFKVVACAEGGSAALSRLQESKPNVVLVDAALGRNRSQRLVESIKEAAPHSRIIMMDMLPEEEDVIDFIKRMASSRRTPRWRSSSIRSARSPTAAMSSRRR